MSVVVRSTDSKSSSAHGTTIVHCTLCNEDDFKP